MSSKPNVTGHASRLFKRFCSRDRPLHRKVLLFSLSLFAFRSHFPRSYPRINTHTHTHALRRTAPLGKTEAFYDMTTRTPVLTTHCRRAFNDVTFERTGPRRRGVDCESARVRFVRFDRLYESVVHEYDFCIVYYARGFSPPSSESAVVKINRKFPRKTRIIRSGSNFSWIHIEKLNGLRPCTS